MKRLLLALVALGLAGCQTVPQSGNSETQIVSEDGTPRWQRTELYFAIGLQKDSPNFQVGADVLGESGWRTFVDEVVTPLFPDGLTVFDATGQWLSERFDSPPKLETRVLVILHPATEEADQKIEEVRKRFLEQTGQQSVLRVTQAADVSF